MTILKWLLIAVFVGYGALVALAYFAQRALMYFPDRTRTAPAAAGLPQAEEIALTTSDGKCLLRCVPRLQALADAFPFSATYATIH